MLLEFSGVVGAEHLKVRVELVHELAAHSARRADFFRRAGNRDFREFDVPLADCLRHRGALAANSARVRRAFDVASRENGSVIAEKTENSKKAIDLYLAEKFTEPTAETAVKIAQILGVRR